MVQQIKKKTSKVPVSGTVERVNEKGIKVNGEWWNFSKFCTSQPVLHEGDLIEFKSSKNFINEVSKVIPANGSANAASGPTTRAPEAKGTTNLDTKPDKSGPTSEPPSPKDPPRKDKPAEDSGHGESDWDVLLKCFKDSVRITEQVDSARFSTQDIIKLALTLFIHRTA